MGISDSPCLGCRRLNADKESCALYCRALREWQIADDPGRKWLFEGRVPRLDQVREGRCVFEGFKLRYERGVLYCPECLTVYVRADDATKVGMIARFLRCGWEVEAVERVLQVGPKQVELAMKEAK